MPRHFPFTGPFENQPPTFDQPTDISARVRYVSHDIGATVARWRANGTTPPVTLHAMPDRVAARYNWLQVAATTAILLIVAVIGADMGARF